MIPFKDNVYPMIIGGEPITSTNTLSVINPSTGEAFATIADASNQQVNLAVESARNAFRDWSQLAISDRKSLLLRTSEVLERNIETLAKLLTLEQGKPLKESFEEVHLCAQWFRETAAMEIPSTTLRDDEYRRITTKHVPLGVVGAIVPWNYPLILATFKLAPALLTGNTVVLKPSPFTPLATIHMVALMHEVLPAGVINVVTGGDNVGPWITEHPDINKITFTGSTQTGKAILRNTSASLKRVTLELGGNDAALVLMDADPKTIARDLFWAAFRNNGQICIAAKRIYVHASIYDDVASELVAYAKTVKMGDGFTDGVQLGPIQNALQYARIKELLKTSHMAGVRFLTGGDVPSGPGYFIPPAIADNPQDSLPIVCEEAFGPVVPLLKYHSIEEAISRINDSIYGLAGSVWGKDLDLAEEIAKKIDSGTIWINTTQELHPRQIFAGHKQSGLGTENGIEGLLEYTAPHTTVVKKQQHN
ncbi:aldehyde dehydrogenase family protein [Pseudomonas sp. BN505]|uniref:aldehyde dehydrogenase family protein n=1 Tax=unclassified Pseudomonas TaxID=196821 RepID=UPI0024578DEF|nr:MULTISPECIES: aldehyde dehydrogenase family protein [unclassified Pseudomonas]MDH4842261.1 aldehyde dehydrogenase family protein [Pseudomonas sp. BN605]MDH4855116.1 aldehyde dehydrogenase family protein [Pseudomonas sp. BN505]